MPAGCTQAAAAQVAKRNAAHAAKRKRHEEEAAKAGGEPGASSKAKRSRNWSPAQADIPSLVAKLKPPTLQAISKDLAVAAYIPPLLAMLQKKTLQAIASDIGVATSGSKGIVSNRIIGAALQ